jgi:hypothetical protein
MSKTIKDVMIETFVMNNLDMEENADKVVLEFIARFINHKLDTSNDYNVIMNTFSDGYCWYFAHMLSLAFDEGEVCWCAPYSHFVWIKDGIAYDIDGVSIANPKYYIPEKYIKEGLDDFKHVPGKVFNASEEYIQDAINRYLADKENINEQG